MKAVLLGAVFVAIGSMVPGRERERLAGLDSLPPAPAARQASPPIVVDTSRRLEQSHRASTPAILGTARDIRRFSR